MAIVGCVAVSDFSACVSLSNQAPAFCFSSRCKGDWPLVTIVMGLMACVSALGRGQEPFIWSEWKKAAHSNDLMVMQCSLL